MIVVDPADLLLSVLQQPVRITCISRIESIRVLPVLPIRSLRAVDIPLSVQVQVVWRSRDLSKEEKHLQI